MIATSARAVEVGRVKYFLRIPAAGTALTAKVEESPDLEGARAPCSNTLNNIGGNVYI